MTSHKATDLLLDLHALPRHPGEMISRHLEVPAPADIGVSMIGVPEASPIVLDLTCQSAGDGVLVQGSATVELAGQCGRCLEDFRHEDRFALQELYFYPGKGPQDDESADDALFVVDNIIDLEPVLRAAIVLNLPFNPLCREDCAGLCQTCGADLNQQPEHRHDSL